MPFLLVTGFPSCGKTTIAHRIKQFFEEKNVEVRLVQDDDIDGFDRAVYNDNNKEKSFRSSLRSEVQRKISKDALLICDGLNYIKGFRYELFLTAKLAKTSYAVLQLEAEEPICVRYNSEKPETSRYSVEQLKNLIFRYEKPDARQRWDSPLYEIQVGNTEALHVVDPDDMTQDLDKPSPRFAPLPLQELYEWLFEGTVLSPNASTTIAPIAPTNFLHELDRTTQEVVQEIIAAQRLAIIGQDITVTAAVDGKNKFHFTKNRSLPELTRLRRQFITFSKTHPIEGKAAIAGLFVDYLNANCK